MRKLFTIILLAVTMFTTAYAQGPSDADYQIKLAYNEATVSILKGEAVDSIYAGTDTVTIYFKCKNGVVVTGNQDDLIFYTRQLLKRVEAGTMAETGLMDLPTAKKPAGNSGAPSFGVGLNPEIAPDYSLGYNIPNNPGTAGTIKQPVTEYREDDPVIPKN